MFELVRKGSAYHIVRRALPPAQPAVLPQPVDADTWKHFVHAGAADLRRLKKPIRESWRRCREMGVDPAAGKCWDIRPLKELGPEYQRLSGLMAESGVGIFDFVKGRELLVTVSDRCGYLVSMCGDYRALLAADRLNFGPGANWSEASVGTNAIGTALATARPLQVAGLEHFCESHHHWVCSAAPIFDLEGDVIGCVDISGPREADHRQMLALAVQGARLIESRLFRQMASELKHSARLITSVFNTVTTGLVYLDAEGRVRAVNPPAAVLLGRDAAELVGVAANQCFDLGQSLRRLKTAPQQYLADGIDVACRRHPRYSVRAYPVTSPNHTLSGLLVVLQERQRIRSGPPAAPVGGKDPFDRVIGSSSCLQRALAAARRVARTDATVLITGESGTGKEIVARAMHEASGRRTGPFVAVNCGAIAPELIQSELFGYVEGAFTGARRGGSAGKFEQASGGTLFLDEIAEMPLGQQVNLLRVLEAGRVTRVGGSRPIPVDVRIIAATNQELTEKVAKGAFRQDLYYRLNVVCLAMPPLRDRGRDLTLLADHFVDEMARKLGHPVRRVTPDFYQTLAGYDWPGNVRELRHAIEGAIALLMGEVLTADCLAERIHGSAPKAAGPKAGEVEGFNLEAVQAQTIRRAWEHFGGNVSRMARELGIGRNTLYAKMKKMGMI